MKKNPRAVLAALAIAALMTLSAGLGLLETADWAVSDAWYQDPLLFDGEIVLVGIDQKAIEDIGPYDEWGREIVAMAIEYLNESEDCRPAAICLDVLYIGESDPEADAWLAEAAEAYGNVVTGCAALFEDGFVEGEDGEFFRDRFAIRLFEEPFPAMREAATIGHINAMLDADGILRHHLLTIHVPDGREIPSMVLAAAQKYQDFYDLGPVERPPTDGNGFWYVPFSGGPGDLWESISVADLLAGEVPPDYFAGKVVLIGPYAPGLQDSYFTSIDHAEAMYGVEYQANAIQALIRGDHKREVGDGLQLAALFLLLVLSLAAFWLSLIHI